MKTISTLQEAIKYFADPDNALEFMVQLRWPNGVTCQICGSKDVTFIKTRRIWKCKNAHSKRQFSVKKNSIFEDSPIGLDKWLAALWLLANCKNGISSYELARDLGVTQKTGWFMTHRIRLAMQQGSFEKMGGQTGPVEADETYIGGKARFMHKGSKRRNRQLRGRSTEGKAVVMGLLERHPQKGKSRVKAAVLPNVTRKTLHAEIRANVEEGSELFTDAYNAYLGLDPDYEHKVIDHAETYVQGNVHTNSMENFWSLLKRSIKGTYVSVEPFHLFRYLDEQAFRFNERKDENGDAGRFEKVAKNIWGKRLMYKQLIAQPDTTSAPAF